MNTTALSTNTKTFKMKNVKDIVNKLTSSYTNYCDRHGNEKLYWFMKSIIVIPCVVMVPSIIAFHTFAENHEVFVGLCMALFVCNMLIHVSEASSRYYIPVYHATIALMILIPTIAYMITNI